MFGFRRKFDHDGEPEFEHFRPWRRHQHCGPKFRGHGPFGGDFGPGGRKRQRRGDIKFILLELIKEQPRHGYELIKVLEERYGGFYRPSPGSVYPTLQLLEDEGNVRSETTDGKRVYSITEAGEKLLAEREQENTDRGGDEERPWRRGFGGFGGQWGGNEPQRDDLRRSVVALMESVVQAGRYGTPDQIKAVQELINKTNQEVHSILARKTGTPPDTL